MTLNIQKASEEEFQTLHGIGVHKSAKLLKVRGEKSLLSMEDIISITGIKEETWLDWITDKTITIGLNQDTGFPFDWSDAKITQYYLTEMRLRDAQWKIDRERREKQFNTFMDSMRVKYVDEIATARGKRRSCWRERKRFKKTQRRYKTRWSMAIKMNCAELTIFANREKLKELNERMRERCIVHILSHSDCPTPHPG